MASAKTWDETPHKLLKALTVGFIWQPKEATRFGKWLNPWQINHNAKVQSLLKPWYIFGVISIIFYLRFAHGSGAEATNVWGIVIPLGIALYETWVTICIFVAGPKHEVEGYYAAQAAVVALNAGLSIRDRERKAAQASYDQQLNIARQVQAESARKAAGLPF